MGTWVLIGRLVVLVGWLVGGCGDVSSGLLREWPASLLYRGILHSHAWICLLDLEVLHGHEGECCWGHVGVSASPSEVRC
ncbi:hypothetical protein BKA65DRAFT_33989 [Rhexocercosporidium sp. MPI-PUGE-AT-0058]|nr:hypothetical protein BKA65DRAFT_33989 [Rhexocercosporidium sp. MPI-PUGE-AT-0058]